MDVSAEMNALNEIIPRAEALTVESEVDQILALYFKLRQVKRQILFKSPEVDFSKIICVDSDVPTGNESLARGEMYHRKSRLLILDDITGTVTSRQLVPTRDSEDNVSLLRFDLSYDAQRVVFSMKPNKERAYHLYEVGIEGNDFRQITSGTYSDIDPIYLPQGGYAFLSTRGEVYVQCGPWARSYVLARCDAKGANIYLLSPGTEAEYSPSLLDDGRILYTRWEYVDKGPQRIQSLWTMRPDGTAASAFWGNQSVWPDHLGDARQIPGTSKVLFKATSHHEFSAGCIGIVDSKDGLNYPDGIWKVTQELPWPEVGEGPIPVPGAVSSYHTSGQYVTYHTPYPLSKHLFLVSAGRGWREILYNEQEGANRLFLMDIYGNRELIYKGERGILYAQPLRPRKAPFSLADTADFPGSEKNNPVIRPGVFFSKDIYENAPPEIRKHGKFLRIVENMPKNYSTGILTVGGKRFGAPGPNVAWTPGREDLVSGPATGLSTPLATKRVLGTVPIRPDGSVLFEAPPCRMLYFQVLDKEQRCIHTMRSWVSVRPGEYRGCVGCHELQNQAPAPQLSNVNYKPDLIKAPSWGARSLSYIKDIQPIFEKNCAQCHMGEGKAREKLDLTLRPARDPNIYGGIFPEPYLTLMMG
ncbi:MAG: HzsA-related protein, partial [Planctomycetota bacterium]